MMPTRTPQPTRSAQTGVSDHASLTRKPFRFVTWNKAFALAVIGLLVLGWNWRDEYLYTAEEGLGYSFGILGASCMLLLLMYPLKKRRSRLPLLFSTKTWFKIHMTLGIVGPLLILFHCNFSLGAINSNITLTAMGLMVLSGLIGRFIYSHIHYSLFGKKMAIQELFKERQSMHEQLDRDGLPDSILLNDLYAYEKEVLARRGLRGNLINAIVLGTTSSWRYHRLVGKLKTLAQSKDQLQGMTSRERKAYYLSTKRHIKSYIQTIKRIATLAFYERLFGWWHILHVPIFFMLVLTAIAHVYAVHTY
jgi:hypothetical protein